MRQLIVPALCFLTLAGCAASPPPEPGSLAYIHRQAVESWAERCREELHTDSHFDRVYYNVGGRFLTAKAYCQVMASEYGRRLALASRH